MDHILVSPQVPWGDTALVSNYYAQGGGLVATALVACARLGAECELYSLLGDDPVGDQIVAELVEEKVSARGIARVPGAGSPFSFIHVDEMSGERTIFHRPGTGLEWNEQLFDFKRIASCQAIIVDDVYLELSIAGARYASDCNVPVVADLVPSELHSDLLKYVNVLIAPRHFARQIGCENNMDAALDAIHDLGPTAAVITLGADGWVYSDPSGRGRGNAFKVDVVDTTGAGDTFHGAFAFGMASGWNTERCCEFGAAVAALKCTKAGGRTGLPSLSQTLEFLQDKRGWPSDTSVG